MKATFLEIMIVCLLVILSACSALFPDEKLTLQRTDYDGNELKMDGYYYCYFSQTDVTAIRFFYRNGIIRSGFSFGGCNLKQIETEVIKYYVNNSKIDWGVFLINLDIIQYEKWVEAPSGVRASIDRRSGYIENDTTFHITESYYSGTGETRQVNEVWHFKQFADKPDSTNSYIK